MKTDPPNISLTSGAAARPLPLTDEEFDIMADLRAGSGEGFNYAASKDSIEEQKKENERKLVRFSLISGNYQERILNLSHQTNTADNNHQQMLKLVIISRYHRIISLCVVFQVLHPCLYPIVSHYNTRFPQR